SDAEREGGLAGEDLPGEPRVVVERREAAAARVPARAVCAGPEPRVMAALQRPAPSRMRRVVRWFSIPHAVTLRVRPVWSLALAAAVALLTLVPIDEGNGPVLGDHEGIAQFVGRFPDAQTVHVVGSFNDWRTGTMPLADRDHDGVWRATVVLPTGPYEYMFVVDGERLVTDHLADRLVEDDFGRENSILIVGAVR